MLRLVKSGLPIVILVVLPATLHAEITLFSYGFGKQYSVTVTEEALKNAPRWGEKDDNPPLSAKKAIKAANKLKDSLVKGMGFNLKSMDLTPAEGDKWYWVANYEVLSSGAPPNLRLIILMDGTAIKPKVKDYK